MTSQAGGQQFSDTSPYEVSYYSYDWILPVVVVRLHVGYLDAVVHPHW